MLLIEQQVRIFKTCNIFNLLRQSTLINANGLILIFINLLVNSQLFPFGIHGDEFHARDVKLLYMYVPIFLSWSDNFLYAYH